MRRVLNLIYGGAATLAAIFLAGICVLLLANIVGRMIGFVVPSANELSGFAMAATAFLALGPTLRSGGHIRVTLLLGRLPRGVRRWVEIWSAGSTLVLITYFTYWAFDLVLTSRRYGDLSPGLIAVPLWIPQLGLALGLLVLAVALLESLVDIVRDRVPAYAQGEAAEGK